MRRLLVLALVMACRDQAPPISLDGEWKGLLTSYDVTLSLNDANGTITGSAVAGQPFTVSGTFTNGRVDLHLQGASEAWTVKANEMLSATGFIGTVTRPAISGGTTTEQGLFSKQ